MPGGTIALVKGEGVVLDIVIVRDISMVGMLICDHNVIEKFSTNSFIENIYLKTPFTNQETDSKSLIYIDSGKIVRSFTDEILKKTCYGIQFIYDNPYTKQQLMEVVEGISPN
jgi:hypothetical protein